LGLIAVVAVATWGAPRLLHWIGLGLVLVQAAFLVTVGAPLNTWGNRYYPTNGAIRELQADVGNGLVAIGTHHAVQPSPWVPAGFYPDSNAAYGVSEFALYDSDTPASLFAAWVNFWGGPYAYRSDIALLPNQPQFEPAVNTLAEAKAFGVRYVILPTGAAPLPSSSGLVKVGDPGSELLYSAPGSMRATWARHGRDQVVHDLSYTADNTAVVKVHAPQAGWLDLRVTYTPGWSARANGKKTLLSSWEEGMLRVWVPAGTTAVTIHYWPHGLTDGLYVFILGAILLLAALLVPRRRRSGQRGHHPFIEAWRSSSTEGEAEDDLDSRPEVSTRPS
jgi:hypothetical protein